MTDSNSIYAHRLPTTAVTANHSLSSIHSLHYLLFTFRSYNPKNETVLPMEPLVFEGSRARQEKHFINALSVGGLDPKKKERYTFCIYYYQRNISIEWPDLSICQDVINDHTMYTHSQAHSKSDLVFISTQYSIIITILVVLQTLLSMHKRHIAHVVQQHLINKAHRFRSSFSSISLVRQSVSSADILTPHELDCRGENHQFSAGIVSSPIMLQSNASILSAVGTASSEENEPFIKLAANKNHVQFLLGEEEESDDTDEADGTQLDPKALADSGPYGDRSDAMQSIAHILDNDKPWCKYKRPSISVCWTLILRFCLFLFTDEEKKITKKKKHYFVVNIFGLMSFGDWERFARIPWTEDRCLFEIKPTTTTSAMVRRNVTRDIFLQLPVDTEIRFSLNPDMVFHEKIIPLSRWAVRDLHWENMRIVITQLSRETCVN